MATFKRNDAYYVAIYLAGKRIRRKSPVQTREGARQFERKLRQEYLTGEPSPTIEIAAKKFVADHVSGLRATTQRSTILALDRWIVPIVGQQRVDQVDLELLRAKIQKEGKAPKTQRNILAVATSLLSYCRRRGWCDVVKPAPPVRVPTPDFRWLHNHELDQLLFECRDPWRLPALMAIDTGMRFSEIRALHWSEVRADSIRIVAAHPSGAPRGPPKTKESLRSIPLTNRLATALREQSKNDGLVFRNSKGGAIKYDSARDALHRASLRAGLEPVNWHDLRHSYATALVLSGASLSAVRALCGHTSYQVTLRYAHVDDGFLRSATNLLGR